MNRHSLVMVVILAGVGQWGNAARAQDPSNWASEAPVGRGTFAQVEALWLKRDASDAATLATLNSRGTPGRVAVLATEDVDYDYEAGVRVLAGLMLNDRTQIEAEYFGIDNFDGNQATLVRPPGLFALNSVYTVLNNFPVTIQADGETELHSGELNARRRGGTARFTNSVLVGFRYLSIRDQLKLDALAVLPNGATAFESTSADTRNNVFGLQLGGDLGFHWNRFHLTTSAEGFVYGNFYDSDARNVLSDASGFFLQGPTFRDSRAEDQKATAGVGAQVGIDAAFCLNDHIILHACYNVLALSDVAMGAEQLPEVRPSPVPGATISNPDRVEELGSLLFQGPSAGLEIRW